MSVDLKNNYYDLSEYFSKIEVYSDWENFGFTEEEALDALVKRVEKQTEGFAEYSKVPIKMLQDLVLHQLSAMDGMFDDNDILLIAEVINELLSARWYMKKDL